jgi:pimeloyl-[acyl-carrier protein] methyl ester esterase
VNALHVERDAGSGGAIPRLPLVLLHGWGMNLRVFDRLREHLPHPVCAIDLPGHGRSPWWPEAARFDVQRDAILAELPPRCVLVGWSMGAKLAMALAAREPLRVASLVLLSATPRFARSDDWPHGAEPAALAALRALLEQDWRQVLEDFVWLQVRGSRDAEQTAGQLAGVLAAHGEPQPAALRAGLDLLDGIDLRPQVPMILQPTLVVAGQNDRVTRPGAARWLADTMPAARLLELPRAGHAPPISHHAEVAAAIIDFLATAPAQAGA